MTDLYTESALAARGTPAPPARSWLSRPGVRSDGERTTARVTADFDGAADRYDLMVALNPGYHRHLRSAARALVERMVGARPRPRVLDLGCGSGASTRALLAEAGPDGMDVTAVDASAGMLAQAQAKTWPGGVSFHRALAQDLGSGALELELTEPLDGAFAAYLFRNVPAQASHTQHGAGIGAHEGRDAVLRTLHGLLRPGGVLVTQEYSVAGSRGACTIWTLVCRLIVMPLSRLTRTDVDLYDYLWRSVLRFDSVEEFTDRLWRAGFVDVEVRTVSGWQRGILHTFRARVP